MIILLLSWTLHGRGSRSGGVLEALHQSAYSVVTISVHQVASKSRSLFVKRSANTKKRRTMTVLANVAMRNLVKPSVGIRREAMLTTGKITEYVMRLEPKV
jgi:hypothetical protein